MIISLDLSCEGDPRDAPDGNRILILVAEWSGSTINVSRATIVLVWQFWQLASLRSNAPSQVTISSVVIWLARIN
jgi:hypothetical protein